jgi:hypothetical protein
MSGVLINLLIQVIAGAIGGNVAGGASKELSLGPQEIRLPAPSAAVSAGRF